MCNDLMPSETLAGDVVDLESNTNFLESLDTMIVSDSRGGVDELRQARKRKLKKAVKKTLKRFRLSVKGGSSKC